MIISTVGGDQAAFKGEDSAKRGEREAVFAVMGKDRNLDIGCRLTATGACGRQVEWPYISRPDGA